MSKLSNRLMKTSPIVISLVSFVLAILVSCVIMLLCGYDPIFAYSVIIEGLARFRAFLVQHLDSGDAADLYGSGVYGRQESDADQPRRRRADVYGRDGCGVGRHDAAALPGILHLFLALVCGVIGGGLAGALIGFLKVRFGSNEVITTTMTNFIIINFCDYLVNYPLKAEGAVAQTNKSSTARC